jgi:PadR family transcriptional regulator PadR
MSTRSGGEGEVFELASDKALRKFQKELNAGALSLVLLRVLQKQGEHMYGYEIAKQLASHADGAVPMNQAAVYPVLRSLEKQGLLSSRMMPSDSGPPRRYYQLTAAGKRSLSDRQTIWRNMKQFVDNVLEDRDEPRLGSTGSQIPRRTRT